MLVKVCGWRQHEHCLHHILKKRGALLVLFPRVAGSHLQIWKWRLCCRHNRASKLKWRGHLTVCRVLHPCAPSSWELRWGEASDSAAVLCSLMYSGSLSSTNTIIPKSRSNSLELNHLVVGLIFPPKTICSSSNPWQLGMWTYIETASENSNWISKDEVTLD